MANAGGGGAPAEAPDVDAIGHAALVVARLREVVDRADAAIAHVANDVALRPDDQQYVFIVLCKFAFSKRIIATLFRVWVCLRIRPPVRQFQHESRWN